MTTAKRTKARPPKSPKPPPRFAAGASVTTRAEVRVKMPRKLGRFQFLHLLPGTEWVVFAVDDGTRRRSGWVYRYQLQLRTSCMREEIERTEKRLRPL